MPGKVMAMALLGMRRVRFLQAVLAGCVGTAFAGSAAAVRNESLCGRDEVLNIVIRHIQGKNYYAEPDTSSVYEWQSLIENQAWCSIKIEYGTRRDMQVNAITNNKFQNYIVQLIRNRIIVRIVP